MSLAGVVLAAGRSARMGSPKALLDFLGLPFVVRIMEAFEALEVKTRVVVLGPDAPRIQPVLADHDCMIVENPVVWRSALFAELLESPEATGEGARAVLHRHEKDVVSVAVDDPAVVDHINTPDDYERLVREWNRDIY